MMLTLLCAHFSQGNRMNIHQIKEPEETISLSREIEANHEINSSLSSNSHQNNYQVPSQTTDSSSPQASEYGDAESGSFLCYRLLPVRLFNNCPRCHSLSIMWLEVLHRLIVHFLS